MRSSLLFATACVMASIGGVVSGASIETSPIQRAGIGNAEHTIGSYKPHDADASSDLLSQVALPDHYAMTTPDGRVEVAELSNRGLYAQRRFGWQQPAPVVQPVSYAPEPLVEWAAEPAPHDGVTVPDASPEQSADAATQMNPAQALPAQS